MIPTALQNQLNSDSNVSICHKTHSSFRQLS